MTCPPRLTFEEFATRIQAAALKEAWLQASSDYWVRRAEQFEASAPRPGDFVGRESTPEQRAERERLRNLRVKACRHRAAYVEAWAIAGLAEAVEVVFAAPNDRRSPTRKPAA